MRPDPADSARRCPLINFCLRQLLTTLNPSTIRIDPVGWSDEAFKYASMTMKNEMVRSFQGLAEAMRYQGGEDAHYSDWGSPTANSPVVCIYDVVHCTHH